MSRAGTCAHCPHLPYIGPSTHSPYMRRSLTSPLAMPPRSAAAAAEGPGAGMPEPSPQELLAMLEELQRQGHNLDEISPDLSSLLRNVKKEKGQPTDDVPTEEITPEPGFVIKTQDTATGDKVFINVCSSSKVPAPGSGWANGTIPDEVQKALENRDGAGAYSDMEALRFPLSCGRPRQDVDKKGQPCISIDCILHSDVVKQTAGSRLLKSFLVELCLGWVGHKTGRTLDPKFKLPKMRYKGDTIETQNIRVDRKPLVCEVKDLPEEPSFPLVTKKPKQPIQSQTAAAGPAVGAAGDAEAGAGAGAGAGVGSSGRGAQELKPSAVYPSAQPAAQQVLQHSVAYEGQPVEQVVVTVQVPDGARSGAAGSGAVGSGAAGCEAAPGPAGRQGAAAAPLVELSGRWVYVTCPGCQELKLQLPLAVTAEPPSGSGSGNGSGGGDGVVYDPATGQLVLRLRYLPIRQYVEQLRAEKPAAFGQLGLATDGLLELE